MLFECWLIYDWWIDGGLMEDWMMILLSSKKSFLQKRVRWVWNNHYCETMYDIRYVLVINIWKWAPYSIFDYSTIRLYLPVFDRSRFGNFFSKLTRACGAQLFIHIYRLHEMEWELTTSQPHKPCSYIQTSKKLCTSRWCQFRKKNSKMTIFRVLVPPY